MKAAVQNRMVRTIFECFIQFKVSRALCILKSLTPLFQLFARAMGNIPGFVDDMASRLLGCVGRGVYLLFSFVLNVAHDLTPFVLFIYPLGFAVFKNVASRVPEFFGPIFEGI